jgi:hypothetical protein
MTTKKDRAGQKSRRVPLSIKIHSDLKQAIELEAYADKRSISSYVEILLEKAMKDKGHLK